MELPKFWKNCSSCKKEIKFKEIYFECNVTTCQGKRTGLVFCTVFCWERHLPGAKHRDAYAIEKLSPSVEIYKNELILEAKASGPSSVPSASSISVATTTAAATAAAIRPSQSSSANNIALETEVLVVVSKMKNYIQAKADMNTSGDVSEILSHMIRRACDEAILNAKQAGRKTVMARDFKS
jgi:histone H3/H4